MQHVDSLSVRYPQQRRRRDPIYRPDRGLDRLRRHLDPANVEHVARPLEHDEPVGGRDQAQADRYFAILTTRPAMSS
jgi:hypothetical protein